MSDYVLMKDKIVKKLFTNQNVGKIYSAAIIANVLGLDEQEVYENLEFAHPNIGTNISYVDSEADAIFLHGKTIINIEFNNDFGEKTDIKNETYIVHLYLNQLHTSKDYLNLKNIIQINIDNYDYFDRNQFLYHSAMMETSLHLLDKQHIEIYHINLQFLREMDYNKLIEDKLRLEELVYILICSDKEKLKYLYEKDELMKQVSEEARQIAEDMKEWAFYNPEEIKRQDMEIKIQRATEKAYKEAYEKASQEYYAKGSSETLIQTAKNLLELGLDDATILKATNLSKEELETLKQN